MRGYLGAAILGALLILGLWSGKAIGDRYDPTCGALESAAQAALSGDLEAAKALAGDARERWDAVWRKVAAVTSHTPMDEIDSLFAQALTRRDATAFAAECARLAKLVEACAETHRLTWWNLF